ncbi:hypothetical protein [Terrisporobacter petrolearius]|nr:hypothetical protein [Terrisporobacter petrolearius]
MTYLYFYDRDKQSISVTALEKIVNESKIECYRWTRVVKRS